MHTTNVVLKDGRKFSGVIWTWRPKLGWVELTAVKGEDDFVRVQFDDVESMVTLNDRVSVTQVGVDVDALERARADGWIPKEKGANDVGA